MATRHVIEVELDRRLRVWRRGLVVALALRTGSWLLLALVLSAFYDFFLPLPEATRLALSLGLPLAALLVFVWKYLRIRRVGRREMADLADGMLSDPHRSLLGAYELLQSGPTGFLMGKTIADAQLGFFDLPPARCRPFRILRGARIVTGVILGVICLVLLLKPQAVPTLAARFLAPLADIPPYSSLEFQTSPENPVVIYGSDLEVEARISGGRVDGPVRVLTRYEGELAGTECYRGADNHFTLKLEKLVRPVEFCFSAGRARSRWQQVQLLLEPRFSLARLTIRPPAYTRAAVREIVLGREEIKGVHGSAASLTITSNRPLAGGEMKLKPLGPHGEAKSVPAIPSGLHTVRFDWLMLESATLEVQIRDVLGTAAPEPLLIKQSVLPDDKPRLALHEPGVHTLATPRTLVPVSGSAQDDFGIRRVDFVRALQGFRERQEELAVPRGDKTYEFHSQLDLAALGVEPGQVIELYLEGRDENPSLSGIQTSDVTRIEIITEEEYGQMLREQISLDELLARFQKIQDQLARVRSTLDGLRKPDAGKPDQLKESTEAVNEAARMLEQFARDFPVFDMEETMQKALAESATRARNAADQLARLQPGQPDLDRQVETIRQQFDGEVSELDSRLADRTELESVGRVLEQAAQFMQLVEQQRQLANWIDRLSLSGPSDPGALQAAGKLQDELRELAGQIPGQIRTAAEAIPEGLGYDKLRNDANAFAGQVERCEALATMGRASTAAQNSNAPGAAQAARQAHAQLAALLPKKCENQFASLCKGNCQSLFPGGSRAGKTLSQCLSGMMSRARIGGLGSGGSAEDGYILGVTRLDLPVFGPQRSRVVPPVRPVITSLGSIRDGLAATPQLQNDNQTRIPKPDAPAEGAAAISLEQIPEKYRAAVRKYFSPESPP